MAACVMQGLIHISELAWSRVSNPESVVQPGSLVKCKVISVDGEKGKIGLSLKVHTHHKIILHMAGLSFNYLHVINCFTWPEPSVIHVSEDALKNQSTYTFQYPGISEG